MGKAKQKVIVALSGGVDSSVAAALLKRAGFCVIGVFMKFWQAPNSKGAWNSCCSLEASQKARAVANKLSIPFYVLNCQEYFKKTIVDYFLKEYKAGRTPNPCVVCNKEIKFYFLLKKALEIKADFIATGHYARIATQKNYKLQTTNYKLLRAKDRNKDQSYFLWRLKQNDLSRILFPVGDYTKQQVRQMAKDFDLPTYKAKESQEVCFIPRPEYGRREATAVFLKKYLKEKPGDIIEKETKRILGKHQGLWFYTIGQRKGIGLSGGPWFVVAKNVRRNILYISRNEKALLQKEVVFKNVNWLIEKPLRFPFQAKAKIRYNMKESSCKMYEVAPHTFKAVFIKPQKAPAPGQCLVFYKNSRLLGGGVIQ